MSAFFFANSSESSENSESSEGSEGSKEPEESNTMVFGRLFAELLRDTFAP